MAEYLKKKIKNTRKKSKGVIQYAEVVIDDDNQQDHQSDHLVQTTEDFDSNNNDNDSSSLKQVSSNMFDHQQDLYNDDDDGDVAFDDNGVLFSRNQIFQGRPPNYALTQIYRDSNLEYNNNNLFQNVDINDDDDISPPHLHDDQRGNGKSGNMSKNKNNINNKLLLDGGDIIVESDAWPEHQEAKVQSTIHKLLRREMTQIDPTKIYFQQIDKSHLSELRALHEEWFPLSYPDSFYSKIHKKNILAIGCFIDLDRDNTNVILGTILVNIKTNNEDIIEMYQAKDYTSAGMFGWLKSTLTCREYQAAYIMTIGVVDECRRMGLGTMLLLQAIKTLQAQNTQSEVIYLHVVDYNESAIRFYERNGFKTMKRVKDHYVIFDKNYDALLLYKDIKHRDSDSGSGSSGGGDRVYKQGDVESNYNSEREEQQQQDDLQGRQNKANIIQQQYLGYLSYITYPVTYVYQKVFGAYNRI